MDPIPGQQGSLEFRSLGLFYLSSVQGEISEQKLCDIPIHNIVQNFRMLVEDLINKSNGLLADSDSFLVDTSDQSSDYRTAGGCPS